VLDRTAEMTSWVDVCTKIQRRGVTIYAYFNNHYAGFGPASVQLSRDMCITNELELPPVAPPPVIERTELVTRVLSLGASLQQQSFYFILTQNLNQSFSKKERN
jgi:hypothetical protein